MDTAAYLTRQGWLGSGHPLHPAGHGIAKPLLISKKDDVLGLGNRKNDALSNQWWLSAVDSTLEKLTVGAEENSTKRSEKAPGLQRARFNINSLYQNFVQGEGLSGTQTLPVEEQVTMTNLHRDPQGPGKFDDALTKEKRRKKRKADRHAESSGEGLDAALQHPPIEKQTTVVVSDQDLKVMAVENEALTKRKRRTKRQADHLAESPWEGLGTQLQPPPIEEQVTMKILHRDPQGPGNFDDALKKEKRRKKRKADQLAESSGEGLNAALQNPLIEEQTKLMVSDQDLEVMAVDNEALTKRKRRTKRKADHLAESPGEGFGAPLEPPLTEKQTTTGSDQVNRDSGNDNEAPAKEDKQTKTANADQLAESSGESWNAALQNPQIEKQSTAAVSDQDLKFMAADDEAPTKKKRRTKRKADHLAESSREGLGAQLQPPPSEKQTTTTSLDQVNQSSGNDVKALKKDKGQKKRKVDQPTESPEGGLNAPLQIPQIEKQMTVVMVPDQDINVMANDNKVLTKEKRRTKRKADHPAESPAEGLDAPLQPPSIEKQTTTTGSDQVNRDSGNDNEAPAKDNKQRENANADQLAETSSLLPRNQDVSPDSKNEAPEQKTQKTVQRELRRLRRKAREAKELKSSGARVVDKTGESNETEGPKDLVNTEIGALRKQRKTKKCDEIKVLEFSGERSGVKPEEGSKETGASPATTTKQSSERKERQKQLSVETATKDGVLMRKRTRRNQAKKNKEATSVV